MSIQQIVDPAQIEPELMRIWEQLVKENKMRACLFNLIVFNELSPRTDYVRNIVQKVVEKFPCRILFISSDPKSTQSYLKTAVSVVAPEKEETSIACDNIDIGVAGAEMERVPFLLFSHILPDLPVYLLWTEDPCKSHPLFPLLTRMATRVIFDSESADSLLSFAEKILALKAESKFDIADLNWARTEGWRDLISCLFDSEERISQLSDLDLLQITYNEKETESFCHTKIQSMYLLSWLSSRLHWTFKKGSKKLTFLFEFNKREITAQIQPALWEKLGSGTVISVELKTRKEDLFQCMRVPNQYHHVGIQISNPEKCELPYQFVLGQTATGASLVKEIITHGTSSHYLETLKELTVLDRKELC